MTRRLKQTVRALRRERARRSQWSKFFIQWDATPGPDLSYAAIHNKCRDEMVALDSEVMLKILQQYIDNELKGPTFCPILPGDGTVTFHYLPTRCDR
jgi:hypothetical protein